MRKEHEMQLPRALKLKSKDGKIIIKTLYHDFKDLKTKEAYEEFVDKKLDGEMDYKEYLYQVTDLAFKADQEIKSLREKYLIECEEYARARDIYNGNTEEQYQTFSLAETAPNLPDDISYIFQKNNDFIKGKWEYYTRKIENVNSKIKLINYIASKSKINIVDKEPENQQSK